MLITPVLLTVLGMLEHSAAGSAGPAGLSSWYHVIRLLLHSAHGYLLHKVRRNVGYLAYPREMKPQSRCHSSHHPGAHVASQSPQRNVTILSCNTEPADCLQERTVSLWVAAQRVQALDKMRRAPPFAGPLGLCAHLSSSLSLLDAVNSGT